MFQLLQLFRPFATMLFYRSYVKKDVARAYRRKTPSLTEEESLILAEMDIHANKVPELDPLGNFRGVYERSKADPGAAKRFFWQLFCALFTLSVVVVTLDMMKALGWFSYVLLSAAAAFIALRYYPHESGRAVRKMRMMKWRS